ncbi:HD domain-containing protein [Bacillus lacus]|uniref:HD domain-containing protein n=1 Tax=Metabacillus lacus TaxID=1983721 RepID=A0A7X2M0N1_9BACI|nr:HD domain-containing protein [Metabacillus lacus]MRX74378.1 HD domain-containing protein [Metabacillus lacus]
MHVKDELYGGFELDDVLGSLIASAPLHRLKGIYQGGASFQVNRLWNVTRYEHSIGTMLLIRKLGGTLEEQIAGLLHDVSHTAFSHVVDMAFGLEAEDYHEDIFEEVILRSEIPEILKRYGYSSQLILGDLKKWSLLEQELPALCADRLDYTLRDQLRYGGISQRDAKIFMDELQIVEGVICVRSVEAAEWFTEVFYQEVIGFFLNPLNIYAYDTLAKTLKAAWDSGLIASADLLKEDAELLQHLRGTNHPEVLQLLNQLYSNPALTEDEQHFHIHRKTKVRLIDPDVVVMGKPIPSSQLSSRVKRLGREAKEKAEKGVYVKVGG